MKRSTKLIVALLVVVAALVVIYRLMHRVPSADLEANVQMQQIITDAGCLRCHTSTPELPFYANMPVAGKNCNGRREQSLSRFRHDSDGERHEGRTPSQSGLIWLK